MGLFIAAILALAQSAATPAPADPDALYAQRENMMKAREAAAIWEGRLKSNPSDFESAWKLARICYWLGQHDAEDSRRKALDRGVEAGRIASKLSPSRPEGHFWLAAVMGALAESFGLRQGLKYRGTIKDELETVLKLNPAFMNGSPDRALGRWYNQVPGLFGGDKKKSEAHLRKSLTYDPDNTVSHYFLAETLVEMNRKAEAIDELGKVIAAPLSADFAPEDRAYKVKAEQLRAQLQKR